MKVPVRLSTAALTVVGTTLSAVFVAGLTVTRTDPEQFPNLGVGLWQAIATITTAGYGDVVPSITGGRLVGSVLMFAGIGCLALLTAIAASAIVAVEVRSEEEVIERDEVEILGELRELNQRLERLEQDLQNISVSASTHAGAVRATSADLGGRGMSAPADGREAGAAHPVAPAAVRRTDLRVGYN